MNDLEFISRAINEIKKYIKETIKYDERFLIDISTIWYKKTLQNWVGLFTSNISDDIYKITIINNTNELLIDVFKKIEKEEI